MEKEKTCAIVAARAAGALIRAIYATDYTVDYKSQDSPVTVADRDANRKIHEILQDAFPTYGWLSEETADSPARLSCQRVWVVDPMDGTKEFIHKIPEFAVSIALIEEGKPVLGVVYNPLQDRLFWAVRGQGAWCEEQRLRVSRTERLAEAISAAKNKLITADKYEPRASSMLGRVVAEVYPAYQERLLASSAVDFDDQARIHCQRRGRRYLHPRPQERVGCLRWHAARGRSRRHRNPPERPTAGF